MALPAAPLQAGECSNLEGETFSELSRSALGDVISAVNDAAFEKSHPRGADNEQESGDIVTAFEDLSLDSSEALLTGACFRMMLRPLRRKSKVPNLKLPTVPKVRQAALSAVPRDFSGGTADSDIFDAL